MRILLLSNSTNSGESFLDYAKVQIKSFLGNNSVKALFIPFAAVTFSFDEYEQKVRNKFLDFGYDLVSIHHFDSPYEIVRSAEVIIVGGGNTFYLLKLLQQHHLLEPIRQKILEGTPYIGWSAGANIACPTICTTNDMPIIDPSGFGAFNVVPFQINPHYTDAHLFGYGGETRDQRIFEFLKVNQNVTVVGLKEGTMLKFEKEKLIFIGDKPAKIFKYNQLPYDIDENTELSFLMKN